jgi:hypothetical protein
MALLNKVVGINNTFSRAPLRLIQTSETDAPPTSKR